MGEKPIFYTESQSRWKSFRWSIRIVLIFLVIGVVAITISLLRKQALQLPPLKEQTGVFRKVTDNVIAKNDQKEYKRLERIISEARKTRKHVDVPEVFGYPFVTQQFDGPKQNGRRRMRLM